MNASLLNGTAGIHISTNPMGPDNRKIEELLEDANIYQMAGLLLRGVGASYSLSSGSYTDLKEIHNSVSPLEGVMEAVTTGARSIHDEPFEWPDLMAPAGSAALGALSILSNPVAAVFSISSSIFLGLSTLKRIQLDRLCKEEKIIKEDHEQQ